MKIVALLVAGALAGCSIPSYYVRPADLDTAPTPAVRADDGSPVLLEKGSYRPIAMAEPRGDRVRVRGPGRHGKLWKSGMLITLIGLPLAAIGAGLALSVLGGCDITEHPCPNGFSNNPGVFAFGSALGVVGDAMSLGIGPGLWIAGARQKPEEVQ
jgi:hypothetical protein